MTSRARRARVRARLDWAGVLMGALLLLPATAEGGRQDARPHVDEVSTSTPTSIQLQGSLLSAEAFPVEIIEFRLGSDGARRPGSKPLPTYHVPAPRAPDARVRERSEGASSPRAGRLHRSVGVLHDRALAPPPQD
jgi:hypothetical protein